MSGFCIFVNCDSRLHHHGMTESIVTNFIQDGTADQENHRAHQILPCSVQFKRLSATMQG